jgi:hypothetical protein
MEDGEFRFLPFDLAEKLKGIGWRLKEVVIWEKDRNLPWSNSRLRNVFEYALLFARKKLRFQVEAVRDFNLRNFQNWWVRYPERYSPNGIALTDVWKIAIPIQGSWRHRQLNHYHLCPFPVELVRRMLLLTTAPEDLVLDPFAGSGVVLATANCMSRFSIGYEIQRQFIERYHKAIENEVKSEVERLQRTKSDSRQFSSDLIRLRMVKLPRILTNSLVTERSRNRIKCVVAFERKRSRDAPPHIFRSEDIFLVVGRTKPQEITRLQSVAQQLLERPPLSKYGVEATVTVIPVHLLPKTLKRRAKRTMWLYKQRPYSYAREVTVSQQAEMCKELLSANDVDKPPILSSVRVDSIRPVSIRP